MGDRLDPGYSYPKQTIEMDITRIPLPQGHFDLIICSHVLEHVPDDRRAMQELFRVLRPGGIAAIMVPLLPNGEHETWEDASINTPELRFQHYGWPDHVRFYGTDVADRLRSVGFEVEAEQVGDSYSAAEMVRFGLLPDEVVFLASRPA